MKKSRALSKLTSQNNAKKDTKPKQNTTFGPSLKESKPLKVKCCTIKKLIHYDTKKKNDSEDDIPDENEVYVKENLLQDNTEENEINSKDDDFSIVNINMSRLLSLSNSNSKNTSYNANNGSKENKSNKDKDTLKKNNLNNVSKGGEISSGNGSIESNNLNNITNNNSNSNNTYSNSNSNSNNLSNNNTNNLLANNNGHLSKNSITAKRKKFYDKLMKKDKKVNTANTLNNEINSKNKNILNNCENEQFDMMKNVPNNNSASSNIKITNNTNIILNVKSGTKSLDIRALNNNSNNDIMMRDLRKLHIITKKAICSISTINPLLDTLDNFTEISRQRHYSNNKILNNKPIKELLINDNTDYNINQLLINDLTINKKYNYINNPNININFNNNKPTSSQIINIININGGNYSMDQTKKNIIKNIPITNELSSIKESPYDNQFMTKPPHVSKKLGKKMQYEFDTNTYNNIKDCKNKINKINKLPNKKFSHNNWHGNTINAINVKNETRNNNINKDFKNYIENFRRNNNINNIKKDNNNNKQNIYVDYNTNKNKNKFNLIK